MFGSTGMTWATLIMWALLGWPVVKAMQLCGNLSNDKVYVWRCLVGEMATC